MPESYCCQMLRINLSRPHAAQVKRISGNGQEHSLSQIIISPSAHHLSKLNFRHHLIPPVLVSLFLRGFGLSTPVIVIIKICVSSFDMVAEQCPILGQLDFATSFCPVLSSHDSTTTRPMSNQITASSSSSSSSSSSIRRKGKKSLELKASRRARHQDVHQ